MNPELGPMMQGLSAVIVAAIALHGWYVKTLSSHQIKQANLRADKQDHDNAQIRKEIEVVRKDVNGQNAAALARAQVASHAEGVLQEQERTGTAVIPKPTPKPKAKKP